MADRIFTAQYAGRCNRCSGAINVGDRISWSRRKGHKALVRHFECPASWASTLAPVATPAEPTRVPSEPRAFPGAPEHSDGDVVHVPEPAAWTPVGARADVPRNGTPAATPAPEPGEAGVLDVLAHALAARMGVDSLDRLSGQLQERLDRHAAEVAAELHAKLDAFKLDARGIVQVIRADLPPVDVDTSTAHTLFPKLLYLAARRHNAYLWGPSQSGKSYAAHAVARALNLPYYYLSLNPQTPDSRLVGFMRPDGTFQETVFFKAYRDGGVICLDEVDNASASLLTTLNSALANGAASFPCGMVEKHPDCIIIATGNTPGRGGTPVYPERRQLDGAFGERFTFLFWGYDLELEERLVLSINRDAGAALVWIRELRAAAERLGVRVMATPTSAMRLAEYMADGTLTRDEMLDGTVWKGLDATARGKLEAAVGRAPVGDK